MADVPQEVLEVLQRELSRADLQAVRPRRKKWKGHGAKVEEVIYNAPIERTAEILAKPLDEDQKPTHPQEDQ